MILLLTCASRCHTIYKGVILKKRHLPRIASKLSEKRGKMTLGTIFCDLVAPSNSARILSYASDQ